MFILLKERKRLGHESNQALCFSPERRWNLLLLIISLLQRSVSACNISPAPLGWTTACPLLPVLPQPIHQPWWGSARRAEPASACSEQHRGGGGGGHNSYRNRQSLSQNQHRTLLCWFWYTTGRLVWFVRNERCTTTGLRRGGKLNVFI